MDYSFRPEDEQPIMRVTLTWNGASAEEAGVTHGPCASSSLRPPRHECAGVPVPHPPFPLVSEEATGSWWG